MFIYFLSRARNTPKVAPDLRDPLNSFFVCFPDGLFDEDLSSAYPPGSWDIVFQWYGDLRRARLYTALGNWTC